MVALEAKHQGVLSCTSSYPGQEEAVCYLRTCPYKRVTLPSCQLVLFTLEDQGKNKGKRQVGADPFTATEYTVKQGFCSRRRDNRWCQRTLVLAHTYRSQRAKVGLWVCEKHLYLIANSLRNVGKGIPAS